MSNSKKVTPPGYEIVLTTEQAAIIADFVDNSEAFKIIKNVITPQREDIIGRMVLKQANTSEDLARHKGMANENVYALKRLMDIATAYKKDEDTSDDEPKKPRRKK